MSEHGASINFPEWDGVARPMGVLWTLRKGTRAATCALYTHPIGGEAVDVDGEMVCTQATRVGLELLDVAETWKAQFQEKGWTG